MKFFSIFAIVLDRKFSLIASTRQFMQKLHFSLLISVVLLLPACKTMKSTVSTSYQPDAKHAILYGRLKMERQVPGKRSALWLISYDKHTVYFTFDKHNPVTAIAVPVGRYRVEGCVVGNWLGLKEGGDGLLTQDHVTRFYPFQTPTNSAIYIGDFDATMFYGQDWAGPGIGWWIRSVTTNYAATTEKFHQKFPKLANLKTYSMFEIQR